MLYSSDVELAYKREVTSVSSFILSLYLGRSLRMLSTSSTHVLLHIAECSNPPDRTGKPIKQHDGLSLKIIHVGRGASGGLDLGYPAYSSSHPLLF